MAKVTYTPQPFQRDDFDAVGFVSAIERTMQARGVSSKELSGLTGISESSLSRMLAGTQMCDAASLAALSSWAGVNPVLYRKGAWVAPLAFPAAASPAPAGQAEGAVKLAEDVIDALEDWAGYASDYFKQKHRYHEEMAEYRTRLEALATPQPPAQSAVTDAQIEAIGAKIYGTCFTPADRQFAMEVLALASSAQAGSGHE